MALNAKYSVAAVNAEADALTALLADGYLRLYSGAQPATADTPLSGQTLLAELRLAPIAFGAAVDGVITANPITADLDAPATGFATWYRCLKSDGTTPVCDGSVGTSSSNCNLTSTSIQQHASVTIDAFTLRASKA